MWICLTFSFVGSSSMFDLRSNKETRSRNAGGHFPGLAAPSRYLLFPVHSISLRYHLPATPSSLIDDLLFIE
jgi:hypothetical protein